MAEHDWPAERFEVLGFTIAGGTIVAIDLLADPERLQKLDPVVLDD